MKDGARRGHGETEVKREGGKEGGTSGGRRVERKGGKE